MLYALTGQSVANQQVGQNQLYIEHSGTDGASVAARYLGVAPGALVKQPLGILS
jgi:hypothetical protein